MRISHALFVARTLTKPQEEMLGEILEEILLLCGARKKLETR
jgi:hypothetical protein